MASSIFKLFSQKCNLSNVIYLRIHTKNRSVTATLRSYSSSSRLCRTTRHISSFSIEGGGTRKPRELLAANGFVLEIDRYFYLDAKRSFVFPIPPVLATFIEKIDAIPRNTVHGDADEVTQLLLRRARQIHSMVADFYDKKAERNPVTKRKVLNWYQLEIYEADKLDFTPRRLEFWAKGIITNGPNVDRAGAILADITEANMDHLENTFAQTCELVVIDPHLVADVETKNQGIMSTSDGIIWINDRMVTEYSDDVLAGAIGHEMVHILLEHVAEIHSNDKALYLILHHAFQSLSKYVPHIHQKKLKSVGLYMMKEIREVFPGNTVPEAEADKYGMMMMSRVGIYNPDGIAEDFRDLMDPKKKHKHFPGGFMDMKGPVLSADESAFTKDLTDLYLKTEEGSEGGLQRYKAVNEMVDMYRFENNHPPLKSRREYSKEQAELIHFEKKKHGTVRNSVTLPRVGKFTNLTDLDEDWQ